MIKSCQFMIFGATGDLTYLKLMPAIYGLYKEGELCNAFQLVCIGRKELNLDQYLESLDAQYTNQLEFETFKSHIVYKQMDFSDKESYESLQEYLGAKNWIFYLATAPRYFETITTYLNDYGYLKEIIGFRRIVFEKPFGVNFHDAKSINKHISKFLEESQIFRIDHYLGKEMIQNILLTRAYNSFFELLWHHDAIDYFEIVISEKNGVKNRGGYYDQSGAMKDMVQNHMFQVVSLLAMDLPETLIPESIQEEKAKVLKKIEVTDNIVLGQYSGYLNEKGIDEKSKTETFVALEVKVHTKRWKDVSFYLKTGKALAEKYAHIVVHFKKNHTLAKDNILVIQVQPEEGIMLRVNSKEPGVSNTVTPVMMDYCHSCLKYGDEPSAYGRLLLDIILGDKSLFASWSEIESSWLAIDKLQKPELVIYDKNKSWDSHIVLEKGWWQRD